MFVSFVSWLVNEAEGSYCLPGAGPELFGEVSAVQRCILDGDGGLMQTVQLIHVASFQSVDISRG